ncbi:hypothetical protein [Streptosporangium carneum]|uniref:Uncharacterized protein n=1 Tax=Streptosporangium carneum TaxID=47481 RepID=A0A9W6I344_9ACTN|nr:hypothetical protein [Streptosporangium carneum]GLK11161.1 hypothetical protein GCM10017600_45670 [Streptosporangium carneum]
METTTNNRRTTTARWPRRAAYAASAWSLLYGGLGLHWALGGAGFPFGEGDIPDARAESLLGASTAAGTAPVIAALGFAGAALALVMARARPRGAAPAPATTQAGSRGGALAPATVRVRSHGAALAPTTARMRPRGVVRVAVLATAWLAAFTLVGLIPDARVLTAVAYAPIFLVGLPFGWPDADYFEAALPWPVLNLILCLAGGVLWAGAALAFQRRTDDSCGGCGRSAHRTATWTTPASAARWGRWAAYTAFVIPLFYAVIRWAWALNIPLLFSEEELRWLRETGLVWAGAALATFAAGGGVLALGLVHRWGEVWPRWVIGLRGRRVPPAFPVTFASVVTVVLLSAGTEAVRITKWTDPAAWLSSPMTYWPIWAVALGVATLAYHLRRRGRCRHCGLL